MSKISECQFSGLSACRAWARLRVSHVLVHSFSRYIKLVMLTFVESHSYFYRRHEQVISCRCDRKRAPPKLWPSGTNRIGVLDFCSRYAIVLTGPTKSLFHEIKSTRDRHRYLRRGLVAATLQWPQLSNGRNSSMVETQSRWRMPHRSRREDDAEGKLTSANRKLH
jgi:hypothetical protein